MAGSIAEKQAFISMVITAIVGGIGVKSQQINIAVVIEINGYHIGVVVYLTESAGTGHLRIARAAVNAAGALEDMSLDGCACNKEV